MAFSARSCPRLLAPILLSPLALAQVTITQDAPTIYTRIPCTLTASHEDGKARTWDWTLART